jgi:hypothetical protein
MAYLFNPDISNNVYVGEYYVFDTSGGFTIEEGFQDISLTNFPVEKFDVTNAIQLHYSVRRLNDKLGIIKDESNNVVLDLLNYDNTKKAFNIDQITITSEEFLNNINTNSVISMGNMSSLYSDFNYTVMKYFGDPLGFATIFNYDNFTVNNGVFDASSYINLINGITFNMVGNYITDLSGYVTLYDINNNIREACKYDLFTNRYPPENYSLFDGFIAGDLIYIPNGFTVTLTMNIQAEPYAHIRNIGPTNLSLINNQINYVDTSSNTSKVTTYSLTNITQTFTVPILLVLTDTDTFNINNFGLHWTDATSATIGPKRWLAVSLSANGQYQSAVNADGDIYVSDDYGITWNTTFNIGPIIFNGLNENYGNCIAISLDGSIQVASNGKSIFVSYDYGHTWIDQLDTVDSLQIYVSISLNGQYQTVISCGDTAYFSSDYGNNWSFLYDNTDDLYNSINNFQYAGCGMSYNGQYQTIACEYMFISTDYGNSFTRTFLGSSTDNVFDNRNWRGVSVSATGQYQTAVDDGGYIYLSSDFGSNWNFAIDPVVVNKSWVGISMSANGKYQTAVDRIGGCVHFSLDYGFSWQNTPSPIMQNRVFQAVGVSANGQYQTVVEDGGSIYVSNLL